MTKIFRLTEQIIKLIKTHKDIEIYGQKYSVGKNSI